MSSASTDKSCNDIGGIAVGSSVSVGGGDATSGVSDGSAATVSTGSPVGGSSMTGEAVGAIGVAVTSNDGAAISGVRNALASVGLSLAESDATWLSAESDCCIVHVVSNTAAHRDIDQLVLELDEAFQEASATLSEPISGPYHVYLVDRVIGQGGYALNSMVVSYLDRNYAGGVLREVLIHEAVHLLDRQFATDQITFFSEGLAVWVAGGHYQKENLGQRMAALVELGENVPLTDVIDDFFATQHEIGYLEAASLVAYLVEIYEWPAVRAFYRDTTAEDGATLAEATNANLLFYFGRSLEDIESDWMAYLQDLPRDRSTRTNLQTTIRYYDVMRRYQTVFDPTAYYQLAWLPSPEEAEKRGATADFSRHPESDTNIALETILHAANTALIEGEYGLANALLDSVVRVLNNDGRFLDPLANSYLEIVRTAAEQGYEVQQIDLFGNRATVTATQPEDLETTRLRLVLDDERSWTLVR